MTNKRIIFWLPVVLWCVVIFIFSSYPTAAASSIKWQDFIVKKLAHITIYGILAILIYRAFIIENYNKRKAGIITIILCILYGATDEIHQSFTPGRHPKLYDVVFDTIGASLAIYMIWILLPKMPKKLLRLAKKLQIA